jgi:hypothetical protein
MPKLAAMLNRHDIPDLPAPLVAAASDAELRLELPEGQHATFQRFWLPVLTRRTAEELLDNANRSPRRLIFVSYHRASPDARAALRAAGISFAGEDGRVFVRAPGILVERDELRKGRPALGWKGRVGDDARNPFANRSSRVARWLLLHHEELFSPGELASAVDLNPAAVSRVVRGLEDDALVRAVKPVAGGRRRPVRVERPLALLEAWLPLWQRRRIASRYWDIGARNTDEALSLLREVADVRSEGWAIGGLAGMAMVRRAVEPANVVVWASSYAAEALENDLQPESQPVRGQRGTVRVLIAPDPWTLDLARPIDGLPIADNVQLWLDCASEGERALEAADAVAEEVGWS